MEKSCHSTADSSSSTVTTAASFDKDNPYLKHLGLNRLSHNISKPSHPSPNPTAAHTLDHPADNLHQPPVYTINKSDFREVVQKLTGSPARDRLSSPPPIQPPKPPSSRLQRIRPPPLPQLSLQQNRSSIPSNQIQIHAPPPSVSDTRTNVGATGGFNPMGRPMAPSSPLPPLPSVLAAAAESPVSAYMRHLHSSSPGDSRPSLFSGFSPLATLPPASPQFQLPLSPRPFGCLNSPRSPYPPLSPGLLFSPSSGQMGYPQILLSPTDKGGGI